MLLNPKLLDYDKVSAIIRSCRTSGQNNVAYAVVHRFGAKYGWDSYTLQLFALCDLNMNQIYGNYGGLPDGN